MIALLLKKYKQLPLTVKASLWYLIASFFQKGISTLTTPIFTRIMTTQEYGQYQVYLSWHGIITIIVSLCIYYDVCAQGLVKYSERQESFVSSLQGLTIVLTSVWIIIYLIFRDSINAFLKYNTIQMICMLITVWATAAYQFWAAERRVKYQYKSLAILTISVTIIKPLFEIILVLNVTDKVTARIVAVTIAELLCYSGLFLDQMKRGKTFFSAVDWKQSIKMAVPLIPHYMSQRILQSSDRIMIERLVGSHEAGLYSLAYSVSVLMTLLTASITQTITPWLYKKIREKQFSAIPKVVYPILIIVAIASIFLIGLAPELVIFFAPKQYQEAILVIPSVAMSVFFIFSYCFFSVFEFYYEKTRYVTVATAIGAVLNIALNYLFIKPFGYYAAGYTTLFCYMLYTIAHYSFMRKVCREELDGEMVYNPRILSVITLLFLIAGFIFLILYKHTMIRYTVMAVICIIGAIKRKKIVEVFQTFLGVNRQ